MRYEIKKSEINNETVLQSKINSRIDDTKEQIKESLQPYNKFLKIDEENTTKKDI